MNHGRGVYCSAKTAISKTVTILVIKWFNLAAELCGGFTEVDGYKLYRLVLKNPADSSVFRQGDFTKWKICIELFKIIA